MNYSSGYQACAYIDGTSGTGVTVTGIGPPGNYRTGVSANGYPMQAVYAGFGSFFYLREFLASDLSSYNQYGISGSQNSYQTKSPFFWAPVNNLYYLAEGSSGGSTIYILIASSSSPGGFSNVGTISPAGATGITSLNFIEQSNGTLWVFGRFISGSGKYANIVPLSYYSTDAGNTWSQGSIEYTALAKNYTP